jgi:hypothetical protein
MRRERLRPVLGILWVYVAAGIVLSIMGAWGLAAGTLQSPVGTDPIVAGGVGLLAGFLMVIIYGNMARPARLTETCIVKARSLRQADLLHHQAIPLAREVALKDISGVGMVCVPGGRFQGWMLRVWVGDEGTEQPIGFFRAPLAPARDPKTGKRRKIMLAQDYIPPPDDGSRLEQTRSGKIAKRIYEQALSVQGPNGPLATKKHHCDVPLARLTTPPRTGVWAPDGTFRIAGRS